MLRASPLLGEAKQQVAIPRALAVAAAALLSDEITSSLNPKLDWEVVETLLGLKRGDPTLLPVTHEVGLARQVADRLVLLVDGRVLEEGATARILEHPETPRAQQFLARLLV